MKHSRFPVFIKSRYIRSIFPLFILIFIFFNTELKNIDILLKNPEKYFLNINFFIFFAFFIYFLSYFFCFNLIKYNDEYLIYKLKNKKININYKNIKSIEDSIVQTAYGSRGIMYQQQYIFNVLLPGDYKETQYEFDIDNFKNVRDFRKLLTKAKSANPDINLKRNTQSLKLKEKVDHITVEDFI